MRDRTFCLTAALLVTLTCVGATLGQPPGGRGRGPGGFRPGGFGGGVERALDDLKLSDKKKEQAEAAVKDYQENVRKLTGLARSDLLLKMKDVLSDDEFKTFKSATDRPFALAGDRGGPGGGFRGGRGRGGRGVSADEITERILSFDKNKDGKVTKDELPERMQYLIEKGDSNKDGALDKDEIKKLATDLARDGFGGRGGRGFGGPGGPGGFGGGVQQAVDDLKLSDKKKEQADAAVKDFQDNVRKLLALNRSDLLLKMKDVLSDDEFKTFKSATDRPSPQAGDRGGPGGGFPGGPGRGGPGRGRGGRGVSADEITERILSFDKNKDGKVTKDELPERMQYLIEKGDTNKDGALDKDEIKKLATDLARDGAGGFGGRGRGGRGGPRPEQPE